MFPSAPFQQFTLTVKYLIRCRCIFTYKELNLESLVRLFSQTKIVKFMFKIVQIVNFYKFLFNIYSSPVIHTTNVHRIKNNLVRTFSSARGCHQLDCLFLEPSAEPAHDRDALAPIAGDIHYPLGLLSLTEPGKYSIFNFGLMNKKSNDFFF